jgi:hypothetical protein
MKYKTDGPKRAHWLFSREQKNPTRQTALLKKVFLRKLEFFFFTLSARRADQPFV